jgi:hypothetical protein
MVRKVYLGQNFELRKKKLSFWVNLKIYDILINTISYKIEN